MTGSLYEALVITIQNTISQLGPMPNECGDPVKKIMKDQDPTRIMALGLCLDDCVEKESYEPLKKFCEKVEEK